MNDGQFVERGTLDLWDDTMREQRDRIEALTAERDAAYARGYSDAETEISKSALGQRNDFLHSQYANAADHIKVLTAERDRLREMVQASVSFMNGDLTAEEWNEVCMRPWQPPALKGESHE